MKMKLLKQITALLLVAGMFVLFDTMLYQTVTKRCLPNPSPGRSAKTIDLVKYLPFDENSEIVNIKSQLELSGELPVIDGAEGLYPVFSAFVNAVYPETSVVFEDGSFTGESKLQMNNTLRAYKAVVDGTSDIILCAGPSAQQLQYAEDNNVELEFVPIGREAFVFLVSMENPVDGLSVRQIKDIYGGVYTDWSQVGGRNMPINPLQRLSGSGSQTAFLSFMDGRETRKNWLGFLGSPIGFSFRYYVEDVVEDGNIKMLAVDSVYPDIQSIADGSYPIVMDFYAVYDKNNENPNVEILIDWMLSEDGQRIIAETGYSPISF